MKKSVLVIMIVLASASIALEPIVSLRMANEPLPPPARINKFETDNVHILRLQNFTRAVVREVDQLEQQYDGLNSQLNRIQIQLNELQQTGQELPQANYDTQLLELSTQLTNLQRDLRALSSIQSQAVREVPENNQMEESVPALVLMMVFLFGMLGLVILFVRNRMHYVDEEKHATMHAKFHLTNYLKHSLEKGESISKLRQHFVNQGWSHEKFDEALQEAMGK